MDDFTQDDLEAMEAGGGGGLLGGDLFGGGGGLFGGDLFGGGGLPGLSSSSSSAAVNRSAAEFGVNFGSPFNIERAPGVGDQLVTLVLIGAGAWLLTVFLKKR